MNDSRFILLTGATGYVGGRLLRRLIESGRRVRCLVRNPAFLKVPDASMVEVVQGDVRDEESLRRALQGIHAAYYLVHSMGDKGSFEDEDRHAAQIFAKEAERARVERIMYLGGLGGGDKLSAHLASRQEVGAILRSSSVPTIEFRAGVIIGSGSLSFDLVRALTERLPMMTTPKWVRTPTQPIAIEDVLHYLLAALDLPLSQSRIYEIGGPDRVCYADLLREYARQRGLRRWLISVPVLSTHISSLWLGLVTPVYARIGKKLIESVQNETVVCDSAALRDFSLQPMGIKLAIERALKNEDREFAETRWFDAMSSKGPSANATQVSNAMRKVDTYVEQVPCGAEKAFAPIEQIGGDAGWYYGNWLWRLRGLLDLLFGGVGMRRGRAHPSKLHPGDALDFWRVESIEPNRLLRLVAEMKLPGRAWLQFEVSPAPSGGTIIQQTAIFDPLGVWGRIYWYALWPLHKLIFAGMTREIAARAVAMSEPNITRSRNDS